MVIWHGCLSGARCKWFAHGPADATATTSSLASLKSRLGTTYWCRLTQAVLEKRPLNGRLLLLSENSVLQVIRGINEHFQVTFGHRLKWQPSFVYHLLTDHTFVWQNIHKYLRKHFQSCLLAKIRHPCLLVKLCYTTLCHLRHGNEYRFFSLTHSYHTVWTVSHNRPCYL